MRRSQSLPKLPQGVCLILVAENCCFAWAEDRSAREFDEWEGTGSTSCLCDGETRGRGRAGSGITAESFECFGDYAGKMIARADDRDRANNQPLEKRGHCPTSWLLARIGPLPRPFPPALRLVCSLGCSCGCVHTHLATTEKTIVFRRSCWPHRLALVGRRPPFLACEGIAWA